MRCAQIRRAAERPCFPNDSTFRQGTHCEGHNRDTAWFSILDSDWPILKACFLCRLNPDNFDMNGHQVVSFSDI